MSPASGRSIGRAPRAPPAALLEALPTISRWRLGSSFSRPAPGSQFGDWYAVGLAFVGIAVFAAIGALSHEHERAFSASLIYLGLGLVAAAVIQVLDVRWLDPVDDAEVIERLSEVVVTIALFSAGLKLDRRLGWRGWGSVLRLLGLVMPLTIVLVAGYGVGVMGLSLAAAIVLGGALAPTDPVLAGDIGVGHPG